MRKKTTTKRKILTIVWTALVIAALSACGSSYTSESSNVSEDENTKSDAEKEETAIYETPAVENGEISIDADTLTSSPMYINYDSNGTNIQLIAVKGSDGTPRLSLNTCQVFNNMTELYFEDFDIDGLIAKYESGRYFVRYATKLTELAGGQKLVRLYDPSGNLIEVRTPFRCLWNGI